MAQSLLHLVKHATVQGQEADLGLGIPELIHPQLQAGKQLPGYRRLNLVLPAVIERLTYGGVATALRLFDRLAAEFEAVRLVLLNQTQSEFDFGAWSRWLPDSENDARRTIAFLGDERTALQVGPGDFFIATTWTTAIYVKAVLAFQSQWSHRGLRRFLYFIQDFEPGFYAWSSRYGRAQATYGDATGVIAVFNSKLLADFFQGRGYCFSEQYIYEPMLDPRLRQIKSSTANTTKERSILVYGRPSTPRNAFELVVQSLRIWANVFPSAFEWSVLSVGEPHADITLNDRITLRSHGKLSLEQYGEHLARCWVGLSLMMSPHPSYPPLEMADFGAWVITNTFENKDLSSYAPNILSVTDMAPESIAERLRWCCERYQPCRKLVLAGLFSLFRETEDEFSFGPTLVRSWFDS